MGEGMSILGALFIAACVYLVLFSLYNGIGPMPTSQSVKKALLSKLIDLKGPIIELGTGWGTLTVLLAKKFPREQIIAYENSWIPYFFSKIRLLKYRQVTLLYKDFWEEDLSNSGTIICYLYPKAMDRLKIKFEKELSPSTLVVTHTFAIPGWRPTETLQADDLYRTPIYHYRVN